mmetsp:Transcript_19697/g.34013  ORF Transcript_19697/g.34013 Transcript_19697/m.34013 type:complete len:223 (+) Transcript_19697:131-799(+)
MDPSALFKQYEADYCAKSTDASRKIAVLEGLSGDARRRKVLEVEGDLKAAEDVIKRMDMEARSLPVDQGKGLLVNVKNYKADLAGLKDQVKKTAAAIPQGDAARAELGLGGEYGTTSTTNRDRMLTATQRMEQTNGMLAHGREQLAQTEDLGVSILHDLQSQRETLVRSKNTLQGADDSISKARRILTNMTRRMMQNKIIMAGVTVFLLAAIALIVWAKLHR